MRLGHIHVLKNRTIYKLFSLAIFFLQYYIKNIHILNKELFSFSCHAFRLSQIQIHTTECFSGVTIVNVPQWDVRTWIRVLVEKQRGFRNGFQFASPRSGVYFDGCCREYISGKSTGGTGIQSRACLFNTWWWYCMSSTVEKERLSISLRAEARIPFYSIFSICNPQFSRLFCVYYILLLLHTLLRTLIGVLSFLLHITTSPPSVSLLY